MAKEKSGSVASPSGTLWRVNAAWVTYAHTLSASIAFLGALVVGVWLHYDKIVQNEHFGFPDEWFPSVSATIGDRYPERSVFQVFIAITSGSRFVLVFMTYLLTHSSWLLMSGILRTLTCGGWTYVTSTDDHNWHDIFMISYLVLTLPWTIIRTRTTVDPSARKFRLWTASLFFFTLIPLIYFFIQHKVHRIPGAYTTYAFFEWALIVFDLMFDAGTLYEFKNFEIAIVSTSSGAFAGAGVATKASPSSDSSKAKLHGFDVFSFVVSIANWTMFWTVITAVPLLIWYFPLWHMGISGYEALVAAIMGGPILLMFPFLRSLYAYCPQITFIMTTLFGVGAYRVLKPEYRLELTALGAVFATASLGMQFWGISRRPLGAMQRGSAVSIGLICTVILKLAWYTNNPMWPIMHLENGGINFIGLVVGLVAASLATRLQYATDQPTSLATVAKTGECSILAGVGLGGLLFALHSLLSDSSTMILWAWAGYPGGPHPIPHGILTILAMCAGVYVGVKQCNASQCIWRGYFVACIATFVFYAFRGWTGYIGGLILAGYLMHLVPTFLESAGRHHPAKSFGMATFVMVLLYLAHVWVVAYAFVPGGPLLRERSDLVLLAQTLCIGAGLVNMPKMAKALKSSGGSAASKLNIETAKRVTKQVSVALVILLLLSLGITAKRFDRDVPAPHHPESQSFTAGIWTVHFGLDNDMWASEVRMRNLIQELEVDVIGFLESDTQRVIMGNRDLTQQIAEELGYYADFGPGPNQHTWGCCLLSKFPILNSTHHLLPSPVGELAPAIHATLDVYGKPVDVVVFHSGQEEDVEDRRLQSLGVADIMASSSNPLILLSYLVTKPLQGNYHTYVSEHSGMHDIDPSDWDRWCQYILYKDIKRTGYARVSRSTITDTEVQVGKFVVGEAPNYSNIMISEDQVPESLRFPDLFKGQGVRGHAYHVFNEPRYFA